MEFVKNLLKDKKVLAVIVTGICMALAYATGVAKDDIKSSFCGAAVVQPTEAPQFPAK